MLCSFELIMVRITHYNPKTCITGPKEYMGSTKICLGTTRHILHGQKGNENKPSSTMYGLQQYFFKNKSHAAPKVGIDYKRAKSGLQDNSRKKNSRNPITCWRTRRTYKLIPGFQKKKARNLPKTSKILTIS